MLKASSAQAINPTLYPRLDYDFLRDVEAVASVNREALILVVTPSFPAKTVLELIVYAGILKAPPEPAASFDQHWTVWGESFGGSGAANGDPAIGSNNVTASTYGFAAGADYHASPDTVLGFALAGSGTNWSLAQALGAGRSDAFQADV